MPKSPPIWIQELANSAALQIIPADVIAPIGCHFCYADKVWEITLFVSLTEIVGGENDGKCRKSRFSVNVNAIALLLTEVYQIHWQAHSYSRDDELGAHIAVEGRFGKRDVCLRILSAPPERFEPGRRAHIHVPAWEEVW